jgi:hypothetical protein
MLLTDGIHNTELYQSAIFAAHSAKKLNLTLVDLRDEKCRRTPFLRIN